MQYNRIKLILAVFTLFVLSACEEVIFPTLEKVDPIYVVDAFITNKPEPQRVILTRTQPYFENVLPPGVSGALVTITDSEGKVYSFTETTKVGVYEWIPVGAEVFGEVGLAYTLAIRVNGENLEAFSDMTPAPLVDSITFNKQSGNQFTDDTYFAEFWATDFAEVGDAYWIKTYKNGKLLNLPSDINLAYDAAFSRGSDFSGVTFISPIRTSINPSDEDAAGIPLSPYVVGDSLYVEINSLSEQTFDFLTEVALQTDRPGGFSELFATPLANVPTNIKNLNPQGTNAVGFFNVAAVNGFGRRFKSLDEISRVF